MSAQGGHHWLEREDADGLTVVRFVIHRLRGEESCREVFGLLFGLIDEAGRNRVIVNMGAVEALDSSAIGKLVLLNHKAQAAGGRLALCCLRPEVYQIFAAMHLTGTFSVYGDESEAIQSFSQVGNPA
jgi:anti-sigma B factor antagonist